MSQWYAIYTKPKHEAGVASLLTGAELKILYPRLRERRVYRGRIREMTSSLFPCYLFVKMDFPSQGRLVRYTRGVRRIVSVGNDALPVPDELIDALRCRLDENGETRIPEVPFESGDEVLIQAGPMAGLSAVFLKPMKGAERVQLLLKSLGVRTEIDAALLGKA